jgi:hypothetical protein
MNVTQERISQLSDFLQSEFLDTGTMSDETLHACLVKPWTLGNKEALQIRVRFEESLPPSRANEEGPEKFDALQQRKRSAKNLESGVVQVPTEVEAE